MTVFAKLLLIVLVFGCGLVRAETMDLQRAIELSLEGDPRIQEKQYLVKAAQGLLDEVLGNKDIKVDTNLFVALAPQVDGGFYVNEAETCSGTCEPRSDLYDLDGITLWTNLSFTLIKPLYTFGKIENFAEAARGNIDIKQADVSIQRGKIILDVNRAYYGYLTARDTRKLLQDVLRRLQNAAELVEKWLADGSGDVKQSDKHALAAGRAIVKSYLSEARAIENIALDGLRVLTGVGLGNELEVADKRVKPVPLPEENLAIFQEKALQQRPEMTQVESGLRARRSLVLANEAGTKPNVYTGLAGRASYTPGRSRLDNPHALDVYNHAALSPMLGIKWDFTTGVQSAKVTQAQAELDAMVATAAFARKGIPFEVAEQYHQVVSHYERVKALEQGSRAGRRWMISSYADFEAGLEKADKVITAFQGYVLAHTQYLRTVNDYNLHVARLRFVAGDLK